MVHGRPMVWPQHPGNEPVDVGIFIQQLNAITVINSAQWSIRCTHPKLWRGLFDKLPRDINCTVVSHPSLRLAPRRWLFVFPRIKKIIQPHCSCIPWRRPDVSDDTRGRQLARCGHSSYPNINASTFAELSQQQKSSPKLTEKYLCASCILIRAAVQPVQNI